MPPKPLLSNLPIQHPSTTLLTNGILPTYPPLSIPSFNIFTFPSILRTANLLDPTHTTANTLLDIHHLLAGKWDAEASYGFSDIIGLASPVLRARGNTATRIPAPTPCYTSIISSTEGFIVFHHRLAEYITERESRGKEVSAQIKSILQSYESLSSRFPEWESEIPANDPYRPRDLAFLEAVHDAWDTCTAYFVSSAEAQRKPGVKALRYYDLMASQITHAVNWWADAWENIRHEKCHAIPVSGLPPLRALEAEGMHLYFSYVPLLAADMRSRAGRSEVPKPTEASNGTENVKAKATRIEESEGEASEKWEALVYEVWLTMIFRAMCWWRLHWMFEGERQVYGVCEVEVGNGEVEWDGEGEEGWEMA